MASTSAALAPSAAASRAPAAKNGTRPEARARSAGNAPTPCSPHRLQPSPAILTAATANRL
eukprot:10220838-Alexandrium_andersonii.AAC.1